MKKFILIFLLAAISSFNSFNDILNSNTNQIGVDSSVTVRLSFVGDLMCHSVQYQYAQVGKDSFDFSPVYRYVKNIFIDSDYVFGNLETVTAGKEKIYTGYPMFNSPYSFASDLKKVGFNFLFTSNNHSFDRGEYGVLKTLDNLIKNNINYTGTFGSKNDRDSIRIIIIKGISFALLSYSYSTNGNTIPKGKEYLVNLIDDGLIKKDIEKAKSLNADCIIVYFHFGDEYKREPNHYQRKNVEKAIEYGADVIIGSHPHVVQPIEIFPKKGGKVDSVLVAFSLGNFISNQRWRYSDAGVILQIEITKNISSNSIYLSKKNIIPTYVYKGIIEGRKEYVILPETFIDNNTNISFLSKSDSLKIKEAFRDTKEIILKYIKND